MELNNEQMRQIHARVTALVAELGYVHWSLVCFDPVKSWGEKSEFVRVLSGFTSERQLYVLGEILISMLYKLTDEGYVKREKDECVSWA